MTFLELDVYAFSKRVADTIFACCVPSSFLSSFLLQCSPLLQL